MSYYQPYQPLLPPTPYILWGEHVVYQDTELSLQALSVMVDKDVTEAFSLPTSRIRDVMQNWIKLLAETQPIDGSVFGLPLQITVKSKTKHFKMQKRRGVAGKRKTHWYRRPKVYRAENAYPVTVGEVKDGKLEVEFKCDMIQENTCIS